jgi:hypothetical protein
MRRGDGHVPVRTCIGCGSRERQDALLRVVRDASGVLQLDTRRRRGGRGGYLHQRRECWARFAQRKGPVRSWRATVDRPARTALTAVLAALETGE